jgi:hypothetical protein
VQLDTPVALWLTAFPAGPLHLALRELLSNSGSSLAFGWCGSPWQVVPWLLLLIPLPLAWHCRFLVLLTKAKAVPCSLQKAVAQQLLMTKKKTGAV